MDLCHTVHPAYDLALCNLPAALRVDIHDLTEQLGRRTDPLLCGTSGKGAVDRVLTQTLVGALPSNGEERIRHPLYLRYWS